jgi:U3 small nucleolar RNA-associated protein 11
MSAFRVSINRRVHQERAQPANRQRMGLLEKKKDYKVRAKDFQRKRAHIRSLREKAFFRNPDEYYMKMANAKTKDGVHTLDNSRAHSHSQVSEITTQDIAYLQMMKNADERVSH